MQLVKKIIVNTVFAVQVLIIFLLVFENNIEVPDWLQSFGRLHPLLLHLPIGLIILMTILLILRKNFEGSSFEALLSFLIHLIALTTSFTVLMGFFLSREGNYGGADMLWHKWFGLSLSFLCGLLLILERNRKWLTPIVAVSTIILILTGHFGANLTHGEDFVLAPLQPYQPKHRVTTDSSTVYEAVIEPIFESKCFGCHNERKAKGKLVLTSLEDVMKGGKDGALWKANDPNNSLLIHRLLLPQEEDKHMPPKDKPQLQQDEIFFLTNWIATGVNVKIQLKQLSDQDTLKKLSATIMSRYHHPIVEESKYHFPFASRDAITKLNTPYRTVFQIARNEPALQADFFIRQSFQKKYLEELKDVKDQVISINLSNMPLTDDDLMVITEFRNLETLNLNNTNIIGTGIQKLTTLQHLESLSLSGTKITLQNLKTMTAAKSLKEVYVWNTSITADDIKLLQDQHRNIDWQIGYVPDKKEVLRLSSPLVKNENTVLVSDEKIILKHNFPGTIIRYTTDGTIPDSISSSVYKEPIATTGYAIVKAKAYKDGWLSSDVSTFYFFKKGLQPQRVELITPADDKYNAGGPLVLTDEKKGLPDFFRDPVWLGYHGVPFSAYFFFEGNVPRIRNVTLSYANNISSFIMPPVEVEIWGGQDKQHLTLLKKLMPPQPTDYEPSRVEGITLELESSSFSCYKIEAKAVTKLPKWHSGKGEKGWIMVDEVFFNE